MTEHNDPPGDIDSTCRAVPGQPGADLKAESKVLNGNIPLETE